MVADRIWHALWPNSARQVSGKHYFKYWQPICGRKSRVIADCTIVESIQAMEKLEQEVGYGFFQDRLLACTTTPSHPRRGATAVFVRHKPQWHRHDHHGSAVVQSLIAVVPWKTVKTADLRCGTAETLSCSKLPQCHRELGQSAVGSLRHRHDRRETVPGPQ